MRMGNTTLLTLFLIPLFILGGCEQQGASNAAGTNRISFEGHVHEKPIGKYIVHINALTTDQLPQEVAKANNISRSKNRALVNVSVREKQENGEAAVSADVSVVAKNLSNQLKNVSMKEIKEEAIDEEGRDAIYYIGEVPVSNEEMITFEVDLTPTGAIEPLLLSYRQQFFTE